MINSLRYIISNQYIPYENLALEKYLLFSVKEDECILYLWQNKNTVVIGKNQNAFKECKVEDLKRDNGYLVRRLSGGGAVYHDLGNLNFTFLVRQENYNLEKQLEVILRAVRKLSINAEKSGRNDITIDGKKFSGNAFFSSNGFNYHHGTLLVNVNMNDLSKYLNVSSDKLKSKGVASVKSRVTNLTSYNPGITVDELKIKLIEAFKEVYKSDPHKISYEKIDVSKIKEFKDEFSSQDFIFGKKIKSEYELAKRFSWGDIQIQVNLSGGFIKDILIYSDAMNEHLIEQVQCVLKGCFFGSCDLCNRLNEIRVEDEISKQMLCDINRLICENLE